MKREFGSIRNVQGSEPCLWVKGGILYKVRHVLLLPRTVQILLDGAGQVQVQVQIQTKPDVGGPSPVPGLRAALPRQRAASRAPAARGPRRCPRRRRYHHQWRRRRWKRAPRPRRSAGRRQSRGAAVSDWLCACVLSKTHGLCNYTPRAKRALVWPRPFF